MFRRQNNLIVFASIFTSRPINEYIPWAKYRDSITQSLYTVVIFLEGLKENSYNCGSFIRNSVRSICYPLTIQCLPNFYILFVEVDNLSEQKWIPVLCYYSQISLCQNTTLIFLNVFRNFFSVSFQTA